jgi:hypothetical protein
LTAWGSIHALRAVTIRDRGASRPDYQLFLDVCGEVFVMSDEDTTVGAAKSPADGARSKGSWLWLLSLVLAAVFIATGLIGHGPWTDREAATLAAIQDVAERGEYLEPVAVGESEASAPPLYYATGAGLALVLKDYLPADQAARLATGVFLALTLLFTGLFGRAAWRPSKESQVTTVGVGGAAVLLLIGTFGIIWYGHDIIADGAAAAGLAMALYGMSLLPSRSTSGGLWLGTGAGIAYVGHGLFVPAVLGATAVILPFLTWRGFGGYLRGYLFALIFALPWMFGWLFILYQAYPEMVQLWLWGGIDQYLDGVSLGSPEYQLQWLWVFLVMAFPAWVLAVLTLVLRPGALFGFPGVRAALLASLIGWALVLTSSGAQPLDALALLVPLAVIGAGGIRRIPGLLLWPLHWIAVLLFLAVALAAWGAWIWLLYQGAPPPVAELEQFLPSDYGFIWQPAVYVAAAFATLIWLWVAMRFRASRPAGLLVWPAGVVMAWALLALHGPWVDQAIADGMLAKEIPGEVLTAPATDVAQPPAEAAGDAPALAPSE